MKPTPTDCPWCDRPLYGKNRCPCGWDPEKIEKEERARKAEDGVCNAEPRGRRCLRPAECGDVDGRPKERLCHFHAITDSVTWARADFVGQFLPRIRSIEGHRWQGDEQRLWVEVNGGVDPEQIP